MKRVAYRAAAVALSSIMIPLVGCYSAYAVTEGAQIQSHSMTSPNVIRVGTCQKTFGPYRSLNDAKRAKQRFEASGYQAVVYGEGGVAFKRGERRYFVAVSYRC